MFVCPVYLGGRKALGVTTETMDFRFRRRRWDPRTVQRILVCLYLQPLRCVSEELKQLATSSGVVLISVNIEHSTRKMGTSSVWKCHFYHLFY